MKQPNLLIDDIDKTILNRIQSDFPITASPFRALADDPALRDLELSEDDIIQRVVELKKMGLIRRIGGNFVPEKLGFVSTLCAAKVPEDEIDSFADIVNAYSGVTHNYQRDNEYNVWFTFIAKGMEEIKKNLEDISRKTGVSRIINLPATKVYKIKAHFNL